MYEKVWSMPIVTLAEEYMIPIVILRKICEKNDIPIPLKGHWNKMKSNKSVSIIPLPKNNMDEKIIISTMNTKLNSSLNNPLKKIIEEKIRNNTSLIFKVADQFQRPEDLILKTKAHFEEKKHLESLNPSKGMLQTDSGFPDIIVSVKNISRSLRILDTLIKNFKILGYKIDLHKTGLHIVSINNDVMKIYIREKNDTKDTINIDEQKSREFIPNGKLSVKIKLFGSFNFSDTNTLLVENQIEKILIKIESKFKEIQYIKSQLKIESINDNEFINVDENKKKLQANELSKFTKFYNDAHRWKKFKVLEEYYFLIENKENKSTEIEEWLIWAKLKLDWYNPTINADDELLNNVDKDDLHF